MPSRPVIEYRRTHRFALAPDQVWDALEHVERFEQWWPWLGEFRLHGPGLEAGAVLRGVVSPPVPYRMRVDVELVHCHRPSSIDARVLGDLTGEAQLRLSAVACGTDIEVAWVVEMMQRSMRIASRVAHPMLQWGHDRVVDITVGGFRRHVERPRPSVS